MDIKRKARLQKLLQALQERDRWHLRDAAQALGVSEMTLRRDLNHAEFSALSLLGGYIVADQALSHSSNYFFTEHQTKNIVAKQHIGRLAAELIKEEEVVFFDSGTTVPFIINYIPDTLVFTAICYSINTFLSLQNKPHCRVILCGGEFKKSSHIFTSLSHHHELNNVYPHKAFISAAGLSIQKGVTTFILDEVGIKKQIISRAQHRLLVADHSKFDCVRVGHFGFLTDFETLITDQVPSDDYQTYCSLNSIRIIQ